MSKSNFCADQLFSFSKEYNLFAIVYEDNEGNGFPEMIGGWAKAISDIMKRNESESHLLVHIHERFGFCQSSVLQVEMVPGPLKCAIAGIEG